MLTICQFFSKFLAYRTRTRSANVPPLFVTLCFGLSLAFSSLSAFANDVPPTREYKLDNGLKLIVREDHRAPIASVQIWYKVGSSYEPNGITGISHALEHMMFKGTPKYPMKELLQIMASSGADQNAFTGNDMTFYTQELSINQIPLYLEIEADRMVNLSLRPEDFETEIKVVMEERRLRLDDNPDELTSERLNAATFLNSPYHHDTVGWMNDLENMTVEDIREWYQKWYGPNNATVVVVGDVVPDEIYELVKTHFGPLNPIAVPTLKPRREVAQLGQRTVQVEAHATVPRLFMSYNVPSLTTSLDKKEPYALLVLLMALDGGESSRFSKDLVRGQAIAAGINSHYNLFALHDDALTVSAIPTQSHTLAELEHAFLQQITRLQNELLSDQELKRVKTSVIAQHVFSHDSIADQAMGLGYMETLGFSWQLADTYPEYIDQITAEDVQQVAKKYLIPQKYTKAELIPLKTGS